eukprot:TRINITY_DN13469_c0_g1_i1.p1 TRINITY_DN13469_c0_g1~~TRINITY_DN13469_c0_g1_i1.p1  ORF type:complete len:133 (-),score=57.05 TRINITY_DN13469_c0_g1_i1:83-460(-)
MIRRPPRSTLDRSSAASDVYKRQHECDAETLQVLERVKGEWEGRLQERELEFQRVLAEEQASSSVQIAQLREQYEMALENKLAEIQAELQGDIQKVKSENEQMKEFFEEKVKLSLIHISEPTRPY